MTQTLKKQLSVLGVAALCGGALLWNSSALRAQSYYKDYSPRPKLTRDQAAKAFEKYLELSADPERFHNYVDSEYSTTDYGAGAETLAIVSISQKSGRELKFEFQRILGAMVEQRRQPQQKVKIENENETTATVVVEGDSMAVPRPLVLVKENGSWGVDLVETYAKWNKLQGSAKSLAIYNLTGVKLGEFPRAKQSPLTQCQSNMRQIALGISQYAQDYDEKYPLAKPWVDVLQPYVQSEVMFDCPALPKEKRYGYAYNSKLSNKESVAVSKPSKTVSIYETSILKRNAYGTGENLAFRHQNGANYAFADGHVKWFAKTQIPSFKLKP